MEGKNLLLMLLLIVTVQGTVPAHGKTRGEKLQEELGELRSQFDQFRADISRKLGPLFKTAEDGSDAAPEPLYKLIRIEAEREISATLGQLESKASVDMDIENRVQYLEERFEQWHPPTVEEEVELGDDTGAEEEVKEETEEETEEKEQEEYDGEGLDEVVHEGNSTESTTTTTTTKAPATTTARRMAVTTTTTKKPTTAEPVLKPLSDTEVKQYTKVYTTGKPAALQIERDNFAFSAALHTELRKEDTGAKNLVFSPLALSLALVAARLGARGGTATQIDTALRLSANNKKDPGTVRAGFYKIIKRMEDEREKYNVSVANKMYTKPGVSEIIEEFRVISEHILLTELEVLTSSSGTRQGAAEVMDAWVQSQITGAVQPLVNPGSLSGNPQLVLMSTGHFTKPWFYPFQRQRTRKQVFHLSSSATTQVDMMSSWQRYDFAKLPNLKGYRLQMHLFIPQAIDGLDAFLRAFENGATERVTPTTQSVLETIPSRGTAGACGLELSLPKFKIQSTLNLNEPLKKMGARDMFSETSADFGGISRNSGALYISDAVQTAFIEVNEDGSGETSSAAAVAVAADPSAFTDCSRASVEMKADRPFYFHIWDPQAEMIIFAGTVRNPNA